MITNPDQLVLMVRLSGCSGNVAGRRPRSGVPRSHVSRSLRDRMPSAPRRPARPQRSARPRRGELDVQAYLALEFVVDDER